LPGQGDNKGLRGGVLGVCKDTVQRRVQEAEGDTLVQKKTVFNSIRAFVPKTDLSGGLINSGLRSTPISLKNRINVDQNLVQSLLRAALITSLPSQFS
jgi:hypothetical protein